MASEVRNTALQAALDLAKLRGYANETDSVLEEARKIEEYLTHRQNRRTPK